ncbi:MAG: pyruvate ferredoxin oxidoreductase subunit gamma [Clostridia bacterium]|nr:pyruvate ferredoxin oxidoreductase subunit gamma [Clostridia bacterium]
MIEIRIHGRGGQGSVVTAEMLAIAAFKAGRYSQAFPYLGGGGERRGAPVQAFCRIDDKPIQLKCQIKTPDYLIVQDVSLFEVVDIFEGLKAGGTVLINSTKSAEELGIATKQFKIYHFPATQVALETLKRPVMNTAMLGAFAALTGLADPDSLRYAIRRKFPDEIGSRNVLAMEKAFELARQSFEGGVAGVA